MKKDRGKKQSAAIRVYNIVLTYDTKRKDSELEQYSIELISYINKVLREHLPADLPQFSIEIGQNEKLKIGIRPHDEDEVVE